ncbi:MAG: alpha/beta hydrolase [Chloroflexota bacterium]
MSSGFADINGAKIYYESEGAGPALVMIHAGIADNRMWDDQFAEFANAYTVIRYDMRGYGKTAPVAGEFSGHEDLYALLKYLNVEKACVMGCSKGGGVAMNFTLEHPKMASALIMVCSGPGGFEFDSPPPPIWDELDEAWKAGDLEKVAAMEAHIWVDGIRRTPDQVDAKIRDKVTEMDLIALKYEKLELGKEMGIDPPAAKRLGEIQVPTLLIVGQYDTPYLIAAGDFMTANIAGAQKIVMPTAHIPSMERPDEFNQQLRAFLEKLQ